ncbi:hypothetical protein MPSEU_000121300 [Mayamaea pseudoterrestris]|nr:hypothetical protein MPSEU_000121300 [Mayamaea pseudoterrestris]
MKPSQAPSNFPSQKPSGNPSKLPSGSPSRSPSKMPSRVPTRPATSAPTGAPINMNLRVMFDKNPEQIKIKITNKKTLAELEFQGTEIIDDEKLRKYTVPLIPGVTYTLSVTDSGNDGLCDTTNFTCGYVYITNPFNNFAAQLLTQDIEAGKTVDFVPNNNIFP